MKSYKEFRKEILSEPLTSQEFEENKREFEIARSLIQARRKAHMTQKEVAEKMHTSQSQVARLESGEHFPSLKTLYGLLCR
jgi:DNA-binding XRE family transcriptional regulator